MPHKYSPPTVFAAHAEAAAANCHEQPVVDPLPPHQECPECSSVVAISCEEQAPVVPGALVNLVPDGSNEHSAAGHSRGGSAAIAVLPQRSPA